MEEEDKKARRKPRIWMCQGGHQQVVFMALGQDDCPLCRLMARVERVVGNINDKSLNLFQ